MLIFDEFFVDQADFIEIILVILNISLRKHLNSIGTLSDAHIFKIYSNWFTYRVQIKFSQFKYCIVTNFFFSYLDPNNRVAPNEPPNHRNDGSGFNITPQRLAQIRANFMYWFFDQGGESNRGDYQYDIHASNPQVHKNFNFQLPFFGFRFNYTRVIFSQFGKILFYFSNFFLYCRFQWMVIWNFLILQNSIHIR